MTATEFVKSMRESWTLLFPQVPAPDDGQWGLWLLLHEHDQEIVRKGIVELGLRYQRLAGQMDRGYMIRFASSVMNRLQRERAGVVAKGQQPGSINSH